MTSGTEDLRVYLDEHVTFLKSSAAAFDAGYEGEAKRLAVSARVLLHDTASSRSLLGQIGMLSVPFYTTSVKWDKSNLAPHHGPLQVQFNNSGVSYRAPLDDRPGHLLRWIPFDEWWSELIFDDRKGATLTRKQLISQLANREGGAHVDTNISAAYRSISKQNSLGWVTGERGIEIPVPGKVELLGMRQVSHELLVTLDRLGCK